MAPFITGPDKPKWMASDFILGGPVREVFVDIERVPKEF
jgi:hypothetical protein